MAGMDVCPGPYMGPGGRGASAGVGRDWQRRVTPALVMASSTGALDDLMWVPLLGLHSFTCEMEANNCILRYICWFAEVVVT